MTTRIPAVSSPSQTLGTGTKSPLTSTGRLCQMSLNQTTSPPPTKWLNAPPVLPSSPPPSPLPTPSSSLPTPIQFPLSLSGASLPLNSPLSSHRKTRWRDPCGILPASSALPERKPKAFTVYLLLPPPFSTSPCQVLRSHPQPRSNYRPLSRRSRW